MLPITIPAPKSEDWDEENEEFIYRTTGKSYTLQLEHSVISISTWDSKCSKSFLSSEKSDEEFMDYIRCMTLTPNVPDDIYNRLTQDNLQSISDYVNAPMTATTFNEHGPKKPNREIITSELIYYWMVALNIPFECEKWHIKRLLTLIRVCEIKNTPPKKHSKREIMSRNAALNAARRKQFNSKG